MRKPFFRKLALLAAAGSSMALAATPDTGSTLDTVPAGPQPINTTAPHTPYALDDEPRPVSDAQARVDSISITGNTLFTDAELRPLVRPLIGRTVRVRELRRAAMAIQNHYRDRGYFLTNVQAQPDKGGTGMVEMRVIEWVLGSKQVKVSADSPLRQPRVEAYFASVDTGDPLKQHELERAILNLRNIPAIRVHTAIRPGAALGKADTFITVSRAQKTFGGSLRVDNWGNRNTGRARAIANLQSRGFLGMGELIDVVAVHAESGNTEFGRLSIQAPVGSRGTSAGLSYSQIKYGVGRRFKVLEADGLGEIFAASLSHPLYLARRASLYIGAGLEAKDANDRQQDKTLEDERSVDSASISLSGHYQSADPQGLYNGFEITVTRGDVDIETVASAMADQAPGGRHTIGKFTKVSGKYLASKPLRGNDYILLSLRGQTSNRNLDPLERTSLGGPIGVRAFPVSVGFGDRVILSTLEYRHHMPALQMLGGTLYWNTFWDYGHVRINHDNPDSSLDNSMNLSGVGTGLSLNKADDYALRADMATRLGGDRYSEDDSRDVRIWMSGTKFF